MRHFPILLRHELRILQVSLSTYVAAVLFLLFMALAYFFTLHQYSLREQTTNLSESFYRWFVIPVLFMVPLLTMRSIAEERRMGTLEVLMTTPASAFEIVLAKFSAAYLFYTLAWTACLSFPWVAYWIMGRPELMGILWQPGPVWGGLLFVLLTGMLFIAVGVFASSLTRSQLVAGMLCFSILFIMLVPAIILNQLGFTPANWLGELLANLDTTRNLEAFARGIIDSRPLVFFASNALLVLGLASLVVEAKA